MKSEVLRPNGAGPGSTVPQSSAMERRAVFLMGGTVANALLGIVFWAVAARLYSPSEVGRGSALISTATLLATLSQLNLGNVYARFLGGAGHRQRRLVLGGYGAVAAVAVVLGLGYTLLGAAAVVVGDGLEKWLFPVAVAVLAVFALQDLVLVSLDRAAWVPLENLAFGLAKLGLLAVLAVSLPHAGIGISWMVPAVVAVGAVTVYLMLRRPSVASSEALPFPGRRELGKAVGGEYLTGIVSTSVPLVLPLLVVHQLGLDANAYFSVPWLFATSMSLLMWNIAAVLLVEAANRPAKRAELLRRALRLSLGVAALGGVALWFVGPVLLGFFGAGYADNSTWLLRTVALAAPATAVIVVWTTASRAVGRLRAVVTVQLAIAVAMLGLSAVLLGPLGTSGIGVAFLAVQGTVALFLLRPLIVLTKDTPAASPDIAPTAPAGGSS